MPGINVHGRNVHFDFGRHFLEVEAANAVSIETESGFEFDADPVGIFSDFQSEFFGADGESGSLYSRIRTDFELHSHFMAGRFGQRVVRSGNIGMTDAVAALDGHAHAAFAKLVADAARGAEPECTLAAFQVGHAHAREQHSRKFLGWESYRNANDGTENSSLAQPVPERKSLAHVLDFRLTPQY